MISRGNDKRDLFLDEKDFLKFFDAVRKASRIYPVEIHAFAVLTNHFHLLLRRVGKPLSRFMQSVKTSYAMHFNRKYRATGHVFEDRFKSSICWDEAYLANLVRYIHLNPVKAGIVKSLRRLAAYPWTSHPEWLGLREPLLSLHPGARGVFGNPVSDARARYRIFLAEGIRSARLNAWDSILPIPTVEPRPAAFRFAHPFATPQSVVSHVSATHRIDPHAIFSGRRVESRANARAHLAFLGVSTGHFPTNDLMDMFALSRSQVRKLFAAGGNLWGHELSTYPQ